MKKIRPSQEIANALEEMVTSRLEDLTKSEWFHMLIEQAVINQMLKSEKNNDL
tara:strand:- start:397 stop:555 length:159 start_codon:yes stop_codon:yes gene_type:complete